MAELGLFHWTPDSWGVKFKTEHLLYCLLYWDSHNVNIFKVCLKAHVEFWILRFPAKPRKVVWSHLPLLWTWPWVHGAVQLVIHEWSKSSLGGVKICFYLLPLEPNSICTEFFHFPRWWMRHQEFPDAPQSKASRPRHRPWRALYLTSHRLPFPLAVRTGLALLCHCMDTCVTCVLVLIPLKCIAYLIPPPPQEWIS